MIEVGGGLDFAVVNDASDGATSVWRIVMTGTLDSKTCLACERGADVVPLVSLEFRGRTLWICPQHLPLLIHDPQSLSGRLPGAESLAPAEHRD